MSEVASVLDAAGRRAIEDARVEAIALVGSYARGDARPDSDVDLVVLSGDAAGLLTVTGLSRR